MLFGYSKTLLGLLVAAACTLCFMPFDRTRRRSSCGSYAVSGSADDASLVDQIEQGIVYAHMQQMMQFRVRACARPATSRHA